MFNWVLKAYFSDDAQLYALSEQLGDRLEAAGIHGLESVICYIVAGKIDKELFDFELQVDIFYLKC